MAKWSLVLVHLLHWVASNGDGELEVDVRHAGVEEHEIVKCQHHAKATDPSQIQKYRDEAEGFRFEKG